MDRVDRFQILKPEAPCEIRNLTPRVVKSEAGDEKYTCNTTSCAAPHLSFNNSFKLISARTKRNVKNAVVFQCNNHYHHHKPDLL